MAKNHEASIQAGIVTYLRTVVPQAKVFHVPNGGLRSDREGAKLKWIGTLAGVPDLVLILPEGKVYLIEVKTPGGQLEPAQEDFRHWCLTYQVPWMTARSQDDVKAALEHWGIATREAKAA